MQQKTFHPIERIQDGVFNTYSGKIFSLKNPHPDTICIEDIAHALALESRWGNHSKYPYSVAQHSVIATLLALHDYSKGIVAINTFRTILMHDAHEAYTGDMIKPLKHLVCGNYEILSNGIQKQIEKKFAINQPEVDIHEYVKHYDVVAQEMEFEALFKDDSRRLQNIIDHYDLQQYGWCWKWQDAERVFIDMYNDLFVKSESSFYEEPKQ